jgi:hypothetical protein
MLSTEHEPRESSGGRTMPFRKDSSVGNSGLELTRTKSQDLSNQEERSIEKTLCRSRYTSILERFGSRDRILAFKLLCRRCVESATSRVNLGTRT